MVKTTDVYYQDEHSDGTYYDFNAFHVGGLGEFFALPVKQELNGDDVILVEDSADGYKKKYTRVRDLGTSQISTLNAEIQSLQAVTGDLHAGQPSTGWTNVLSPEVQGGIAWREGEWDLTKARAVTTFVGNSLGGTRSEQAVLLVRVPASADVRQIRVDFRGDAGQIYEDQINTLTRLGTSSDNNWVFYTDSRGFVDPSTGLYLQVTADASHLGTSSFEGKITGIGSIQASALDVSTTAKRNAFRNALGI